MAASDWQLYYLISGMAAEIVHFPFYSWQYKMAARTVLRLPVDRKK
jgi:hypothetical protein